MTVEVGYLLDTSIVVHVIRNNALGRHIDAQYELSRYPHRSAVSVVTVGEMYALANAFGWGSKKRLELDAILNEIVWVDIHHRDVLRAYGAIDVATRRVGRPMGENDTWIAATAHASGLTLLTTDKDFDYAYPEFLTRVWIDPASAV